MKKILMHVFVGLLTLIYAPIKLCRQKNKVTFISRQSNVPSLDFILLTNELRHLEPEIKFVILSKKLESNKARYFLHMISQMYHVATCKVLVVDGYCMVASILKHKKGTFVIQMWHALGCIKKFGHQIIGTEDGSNRDTARILKMHENYDIVTCASAVTGEYYTQAFNVQSDKIRIWGMPRVDYIKRQPDPRSSILNKYPNLRGKKTILYIPTFRKNHGARTQELISHIDRENYTLLIKLHPLDQTRVDSEFLLDQEYGTYKLIKFADYIITDYSAVAIEASILDKPVYFYVYDYREYLENRGLNINPYEEMPGATSGFASEILKKISEETYDFKSLQRFRKKYVQTVGFSNTKRIAQEIINVIQGE